MNAAASQPHSTDLPPVGERLASLSAAHAHRGDVRSAQIAAWAAHLSLLEQLLWENGLGDAPDPAAQLAAVGGAVADALDEMAEGDLSGQNPRQAVELAREALTVTFDDSVHDVLIQAFSSLAHLGEVIPAANMPEGTQSAQGRRRLGTASAEELVAELLVVAGDCMAVAAELTAAEEHDAAYRLSGQADTASFEAYLIAAASLAGDHELASVDARWALAEELHRDAYRPGVSLAQSIAARRSELLALLGSAEGGVMEQTFEPVPLPRG